MADSAILTKDCAGSKTYQWNREFPLCHLQITEYLCQIQFYSCLPFMSPKNCAIELLLTPHLCFTTAGTSRSSIIKKNIL